MSRPYVISTADENGHDYPLCPWCDHKHRLRQDHPWFACFRLGCKQEGCECNRYMFDFADRGQRVKRWWHQWR